MRNLLRELLALGRLRNLGGNLLGNSLLGLLDLGLLDLGLLDLGLLVSGLRGFTNRLVLRLLDPGSIWMRLVDGWNVGSGNIRRGCGSNGSRHGRIRWRNVCGNADASRDLSGITGETPGS